MLGLFSEQKSKTHMCTDAYLFSSREISALELNISKGYQFLASRKFVTAHFPVLEIDFTLWSQKNSSIIRCGDSPGFACGIRKRTESYHQDIHLTNVAVSASSRSFAVSFQKPFSRASRISRAWTGKVTRVKYFGLGPRGFHNIPRFCFLVIGSIVLQVLANLNERLRWNERLLWSD